MSTENAREPWRAILDDMDGEDVHNLLTPDEEWRWLRLVAGTVLPPARQLTAEMLDRAAIVLAESRGAPGSGEHAR